MVGSDWYTPGEIRFQSEHIIWLLQNLGTLERYEWPQQPEGDWHVVNAGPESVYPRWTVPALILAELRVRLKAAGTDGVMAELHYRYQWDYREIGDRMGFSRSEAMEHRISRAVRYMSGWRRRAVLYKDWRIHRVLEKRGGFQS